MPFQLPTILMCPPDHYGIEYEINPWMNRQRGADVAAAREQWNGLCAAISSCGGQIELLPAKPGLPDLVFTANAGLVHRETVYLSRFRYSARQPETPVDREWFESHGLACRELPDDLDFEGAGDALFCGETLVGGYVFRSDARAMQWLAEAIGCRVLPVQLVNDRYYHLDTCFCPLRPGLAMWYPAAFDEYGQKAIRGAIPNLIAVPDSEAARFACNAVVIGTTVILNNGCPQLTAELKQQGFHVVPTPLDEFIKAGGSAKCLTLRLDGEDAAIWP
ncbi:MAG: dimethylarginine dimethylaminohydrolase family protein [Planctomycetaceae bacterium]